MKELKEACLKLLRQYTNKDIIKITNSGDSAIFTALFIAKEQGHKEVLIPDQGGWLTYKTFPKLLDLKVTELKTDYGIICPEDLKKYKNTALIYTSYAGYFAAQDVEAIYNIAKSNNIFVILDASGALSHKILCNGESADIILGSFGQWKIADLGYAGFLAASKLSKEIKDSDILKLTKSHEINYNQLLQKLKQAPGRLQFLINKAEEIKQQDFSFIHKDKEGINVIIKYKDDKEKQQILKFCKSNNLEYKECPLYIKVMEKAISIEVKRLSKTSNAQ